jgi:hypothetical protein
MRMAQKPLGLINLVMLNFAEVRYSFLLVVGFTLQVIKLKLIQMEILQPQQLHLALPKRSKKILKNQI